MPRTQPDRSFQAAVPGFLAYLTEREPQPEHGPRVQSRPPAFATWYEVTMEAPLASLLEITAVELREWKREMLAQGQKPASVNRRLSALQSFEIGQPILASFPVHRRDPQAAGSNEPRRAGSIARRDWLSCGRSSMARPGTGRSRSYSSTRGCAWRRWRSCSGRTS